MRCFPVHAVAAGMLLAAAVGVAPVRAQGADDLQRGVARISVMDGDVSVRRGDSGDWVAGIVNAPLMAGDYISTGLNSRAEVQFDSSNLLRLGGVGEIHLTTLEADRYQLEMARGTLTFNVLRPSNANIEVDTPNISVRPSKIGIYRISVTDNGETHVTVRSGDVEIFTPKGSQWVNAGQTMIARGTAADPEFRIVGAAAFDDWDLWNESRDKVLMESTSAQHVPQGVYGAEDLDANGTWVNVPDYGSVWRPAVAAGWSPYSCGRWVWEDWYGWTWVDCASWGWAPFHYGRWFWGANYGWMWYPGVIGVRHYWAPGLVAFFGYGGGIGIGFGFGFGNVGWVPLAPYEMLHPWWGRGYYGAGFNRGFNIASVNIYNTYRNARVANGVSSLSVAGFRGGRFEAVGHASADQIRSAGLIRGQMPVSPTSANLRYSERTSAFTPRSTANQSFFRHQSPASVARVPFGRQAGESAAAASGRAGEASVRRGVGNSGGAVGAGAAGGWRRFGEPSGQGGNGYRGTVSGGGSQRPGEGAGSGYRGGSQQSLRVAPPVVRERSNGGSGSSLPEIHYSRPTYSEPQRGSSPSYSAPQPHYGSPGSSAPRSSGGSSGGGGRVSGVGGGAAHGGGHGGGRR
ncbi:MAG: DUF6600 domain-containing protein [Bryobacteraceae bacterium]